MVFRFEKFLTDNLKTNGFMDPVNFLENVLLDVLKNCNANSAVFCHNKCCSCLISRINPVFKQEITAFNYRGLSNLKHFKNCNDTADDQPFKNCKNECQHTKNEEI